ncbi:hypothetical protein LTR37_001394 [Vermiconidia calcicola]|uniref:Uncharacterized protein n=1 Tax=Vermiconidia calcicola TaxID=1690605 RepID=A0ACC3NVU5_9PEZI|nr:hypothetical protein LTR37_001394 [Vermiconidia calcicola]
MSYSPTVVLDVGANGIVAARSGMMRGHSGERAWGGSVFDIDASYIELQNFRCREKFGDLRTSLRALGIMSFDQYGLNKDFEAFKCDFGKEGAEHTKTFNIAARGLPNGVGHEAQAEAPPAISQCLFLRVSTLIPLARLALTFLYSGMMQAWFQKLFEKIVTLLDRVWAPHVQNVVFIGGCLRNAYLQSLVRGNIQTRSSNVHIMDETHDSTILARTTMPGRQ